MRFEQTVLAALREAVRGRLSHRGLRRVVGQPSVSFNSTM
jgi:hypothetical protein